MFLPLEIERIVEDIRLQVETCGAELIDLQFRRIGARGCLTLLADKAGGISLDECATINRALSVFFDRLSDSSEGPAFLRGAYFLEVNSPGLDRLLKTEQDFSRAVGENLRLFWRAGDGRTLDACGRLTGLEGGVLKVERRSGGEVIEVPVDTVVKAVRDVKMGSGDRHER